MPVQRVSTVPERPELHRVAATGPAHDVEVQRTLHLRRINFLRGAQRYRSRRDVGGFAADFFEAACELRSHTFGLAHRSGPQTARLLQQGKIKFRQVFGQFREAGRDC